VQAEADTVAKPYAAGILELAQEKGILENVYNDLMGLQVCSTLILLTSQV
jgi:F0F1-type ATP synthase delta subunit